MAFRTWILEFLNYFTLVVSKITSGKAPQNLCPCLSESPMEFRFNQKQDETNFRQAIYRSPQGCYTSFEQHGISIQEPRNGVALPFPQMAIESLDEIAVFGRVSKNKRLRIKHITHQQTSIFSMVNQLTLDQSQKMAAVPEGFFLWRSSFVLTSFDPSFKRHNTRITSWKIAYRWGIFLKMIITIFNNIQHH